MEGYSVFDAVFGEMEKQDMVLNLHGEVPSDIDGDVSRPRSCRSPFDGRPSLGSRWRVAPRSAAATSAPLGMQD